MRLDDEVKMISAETPPLISKACELFLTELAYRSWMHTITSNRRTLQRSDIAQAISNNDFYDFLLDIVEESCKNKLFYNANSYNKNGTAPILGLVEDFNFNGLPGVYQILNNSNNNVEDNNKNNKKNDD